MAKIKLQGNASGTGVLTVTAPNTSTDRTITLPDATGTLLNSDGSGANLTSLPNGSQLDHSGSKKIEATSTGITVTDDIKVGTTDNGKITSTFALTLDPPTGEPIVFRTAGTDIARFRPGGGLCFGTDTAAANALDDYEEGTHATVWSAQSSGTITPGRAYVAYTKIGNLVHITGEVDISAVSSPNGGTKFTLPFVIKTASTQRTTNWGSAGFAAYHVDFMENNPPILLGHEGNSHVVLAYQRNDSSFYDFNAKASDTYFFSFSYKTN